MLDTLQPVAITHLIQNTAKGTTNTYNSEYLLLIM